MREYRSTRRPYATRLEQSHELSFDVKKFRGVIHGALRKSLFYALPVLALTASSKPLDIEALEPATESRVKIERLHEEQNSISKQELEELMSELGLLNEPLDSLLNPDEILVFQNLVNEKIKSWSKNCRVRGVDPEATGCQQGSLFIGIEQALANSQKITPISAKIFQAEGIPVAFAHYLPLVESGFINEAGSKDGAVGIWQLLPETAKQNGVLRIDESIDERKHPILATEAAAPYFKALNRFFKGSWLASCQAYNTGEGNMKKVIAELNMSEQEHQAFLELKLRINQLKAKKAQPSIKRAEVKKLEREIAGLSSEVNAMIHQTFSSLNRQDIDRGILRGIIGSGKVTNGNYGNASKGYVSDFIAVSRVVQRGEDRLKQVFQREDNLERVSFENVDSVKINIQPPKPIIYKVKKGDTLSFIAARHNISQAELIKINQGQIGKHDRIKVGRSLITSNPENGIRATDLAESFGVELEDLLKLNPHVSASDSFAGLVRFFVPKSVTALTQAKTCKNGCMIVPLEEKERVTSRSLNNRSKRG